MPDRRFPPPWDIEEANASCFIMKDQNGRALALAEVSKRSSFGWMALGSLFRFG
jgi:hypothetical protein